MIKIINNKKIELTDEEFTYYQEMCKSYNRPNFKGTELFRDLFDSDDKGIIIFVRPPSTHYTSMEAYLFICSIYMHQHIRLMNIKVDALCETVTSRLTELDQMNKLGSEGNDETK